MKSILHSTHLYTLFVVRQEKNLTYVKADVTIIHRSLLCGFGPIWSSYPNQSNPENCRLNKSRVCIYVSEKMCVYTEAPISLSVRKQPPSSRTNPFLLPRPISLAFLWISLLSPLLPLLKNLGIAVSYQRGSGRIHNLTLFGLLKYISCQHFCLTCLSSKKSPSLSFPNFSTKHLVGRVDECTTDRVFT